MSQNPYGNDYSAPNDTQAMYMGDQPGYGMPPGVQPPAPDAEEKLKRSQLVLLGTAVAYLLGNVLYTFTAPTTAEYMGETIDVGSFAHTLSLVSAALGLALFALVYFLMNSRKRAGCITGYVFAGLGILSALLSIFTSQDSSILSTVFIALWLIGSIAWIVLVSNRSVSSILR